MRQVIAGQFGWAEQRTASVAGLWLGRAMQAVVPVSCTAMHDVSVPRTATHDVSVPCTATHDVSVPRTARHGVSHTPGIAFRHLPPNSARTGYATEGALFISPQLSTDALSSLGKTVEAT